MRGALGRRQARLMGEMPEPTAKRSTESTSSSAPSILKPGPMTWLISSARPALASVSQPVPGDHSDAGCSLMRNSKSPAFVGEEAMAKMPAFSAPGSRICTYWPGTVKASAAPSAGLIVIALRPSAASLMLPTC